MGTLADFMNAARPVVVGGNTPWAAAYAQDIRRAWHQAGAYHPRSQQVHLGPSELGVECHRQVAGKFAQITPTNHVTDPWPSLRGVALHAYAEERVFPLDNQLSGQARWEPERKVVPHPDHSGTSDLYDHLWFCVGDHKFLGSTSMDKIRSPAGPPIHYQRQLKLYGRGYRAAGYRVDRIALIAYPATKASLDGPTGIYVWEWVLTPADDVELDWLLYELTPWRKWWGERVRLGVSSLMDVPAEPSEDGCYFCPFYRPQSAKDGGAGCPGHAAQNK